jgi:DNA-binding protein H-NS
MTGKQHMLEPLMASLLTLDWEISPQTIGKFEKELEMLREKVSDDPHSKKLIDLALPICNYLRVRKGSAAPASMQFLHQAIRSLHSLRQKRQLAGEECTERIEKLVNNFGDLMAEVEKINFTLDRTSTKKSPPGTTKVSAGKKEPARKAAVRKTKKESPKVEILQTIKSHKKGIDIATLVKVSGCAESTVRKVVYRAAKEGTIKRVRRGVYVIA